MDTRKHLKDGIGAGAIRSPRTNSELDAEIDAKVWCQRVGHSFRKFADGECCINCWTNKPIARMGKE
jgi:hypothetical protein